MKQLYTLLLMLPAMLFAQTDIDFQSISSGLPGPNWTWTADQTDTSFDAVDNPSATGINTSTFVGELTAAAGSVAYALAFSDGIGSFTFDANNTTVKIMVYKSRISPIQIKFEDATNSATYVARTASNTVINAWEEITFDFYSAIGNTTYGKIVIIPDNSERTEANITYFDNITFTVGVAPIGPSVAAPTPPARNADDVVSFYSDAYANAPMGEYFPSWQVGTVSDNPINGNNTWKMDGLGFAALANYDGVDLSSMEKMYIDYYTTQDVVGAKLFVKLVDTNNSQELLLDLGDVTADSWQTVEIDLSAQNTANVDLSTLTQFLIDPSTDGDTFFIDNWYFAKGSPTTPSTAPTTAPAAPTLDAADVISFYSDSYTNISLGEYFPDWSDATVTDNPIDGNNIWKMEAMNFASVTQYAGIDLSGMNKMYIDYWTTQDTAGSKLFVKLVDTNNSQELLLDLGDVTAGSWQTVEVDLTAQNTANIDLSTVTQFLIDPSTDGGTFFIDNWYFANVSTGPAPTEPTTSPAAPTLDAADVISFYSDSYTNISLGEYFPDWSDATVTDNPIDGNNIWKMEAMNFASVTQYAGVDLSGMNKMYIDYWTTQDTAGSKLFVKLVDTNNSQELLLDLGDVTAGSWQTVEVDLTAQNTANIDLSTVTQFLIDPSTDGGTFFIDNWYFANVSTGPAPTEPTTSPAAPTLDAADVISFYSDSYTNISLGEYFPDWSDATVTDNPIDGNNIWKMEAMNFASVTQYAGVDLSGMNKMYIDYWTTQDTAGSKLFVKLVDTNNSQELLLDLGDVTAGSWQTVEVDLTAQNTANIDLSTVTQFLIDPSTDGGTFFIDNWYFANVSQPGPSAAAPTPPARNAADVISLYSNAYTNVASNFDAGWCGANSVSEISVAGNDIMAWAGNDCQGIVLNTGVDASAFTNYNVDIYIEDGTDLAGKVFNLKFVGTPTSVIKEINHDLNALQPNIGEWVSLTGTVDLSTMSGFKEFAVTTNLANSVWYDNLYVYKGTPLSLEEIDGFNFVAYPNPVENILNVSAGNVVESVTIFDLTGREVMRTTPNATAFSLDVSSLNKGMFLVKVKAGKQELTTKLVK